MATHSRLKSSTMFSVRNARPSASVSAMKSIDHRSPRPLGVGNGTRSARVRRLRRRARSPSARSPICSACPSPRCAPGATAARDLGSCASAAVRYLPADLEDFVAPAPLTPHGFVV
jgi:hypothetical protein